MQASRVLTPRAPPTHYGDPVLQQHYGYGYCHSRSISEDEMNTLRCALRKSDAGNPLIHFESGVKWERWNRKTRPGLVRRLRFAHSYRIEMLRP
jgi:hypothetical protein